MSIAFDAATEDKTTTATTLTYAHTCTGSDRFLYVPFTSIAKASPSVGTVSYNGVAMTALHTSVLIFGGTNWYHHGYYLIAPSTGSNNVSITVTPSGGTIRSSCVSYTGVDQTSPVHTSNTGNGSGSPCNISLTTSVDAWWIMSAGNIDAPFSAGTNTDTLRAEYSGLCDISDSGNDIAATTANAQMTFSGTREWGGIALAIIAAGGGGYTGDIKSIQGVVQASVKSMAGVANASIKSVAGVANQ